MAEYTFNPSLRLAGSPNVFVRSIDEAIDFVLHYKGSQRPMSQAGVLRKLEGASGSGSAMLRTRSGLGLKPKGCC